MRRLIGLLGILLAVAFAGQAGAKTLDWHGTLDIDFGNLGGMRVTGTGVATVNDSSGGAHLNTMRLAGGISGTAFIPVTDPDTTGTIPGLIASVIVGTGTLSGISGGPPLNPPATIPIRGFTRVCLISTTCSTNLPLENTINNGNTGVGVGGLLTLGKYGSVRISLVHGPWTLGTLTGINQTVGGGFITVSGAGFVHGAASGNSSTATASGVIQLIAPQAMTTAGIAGNTTVQTLFETLTLHFVPEPGLLLLIGAGAIGLGLLGRSRMKK